MTHGDVFSTALEQLRARLQTLLQETSRWSQPLLIRLVSQSQAKPATVAMAKWAQSGALGDTNVSRAELRAAIYDLSRIAQQTAAFPTISSMAASELAKEVISAIDRGGALVAMGSLRSLTERIALAAWLSKKLRRFRELETPSFEALMDISEPIIRAVYGSGMAWLELAGADLRAVKAKDVAYKEMEDSASMDRVQVLDGVDLLDKRTPGTRLSYEILCDFLHPNVGDLYSTTAEARSFYDASGTRHLQRHLGPPAKMFSGAPDLHGVMAQVCDILGEVTEGYRAYLQSIEDSAQAAARVSKIAAHKAVKRQRHLFTSTDLCPCCSGRAVNRCALRI